MVHPDICVMTNIGACHLENLGDLDGVLRAKAEVLEGMKADGCLVVCGDDPRLAALQPGDVVPELKAMPKVTFGVTEGQDYQAVEVANLGTDGLRCTVLKGGKTLLTVDVPAFGSHVALAVLPAVAVAEKLGVPAEQIRAGLAGYETVGHRASITETGYLTVIDDCYNANPMSQKAAVTSLSALGGRRIALLGDMKELGPQSAALHRSVGEHAAVSGIDGLWACGPEARATYEGAVANGLAAEYFADAAAMEAALPQLLQRGDCVLVKASRSMHFETLVAVIKAWEG